MESEILKYETQDKALRIANLMGCTISDIEVEKCPYCNKRSYFKKESKEIGVLEVKVCGHCGDCMNGLD